MNSRIAIWFSIPLALLADNIVLAEPPPVAPVRVVIDNYHGTEISDPYRYMEDFENAQVQAWVKRQAEFAAKSLHGLAMRDALLARIRELDAGAPYTIFDITRRPSGDLFYFKQRADENVAKIYLRDGQTEQERLLIDPETFPKQDEADHFTVSFYRVSPAADRVLYGFAGSGSEETTLKVFDVAAGRDLPDTIDRLESVYVPPYWLPDGKSFVYSRRRELPPDAAPTEGYKFTQAMWHTLGGDPDSARLIFAGGAAGSPEMAALDFPSVILPPGSKWAIGQIKHGDETDITIYAALQADLASPELRWSKVCGREDKVTRFAVRGDDIYLLTAQEAPRFEVVRTSLANPSLESASLVVPPGARVIDSLSVAQDALYVGASEGVVEKVLRVPYAEGAIPTPIVLPADEPSAAVIAASPEIPGALVETQSWTRAGRLYRYDASTHSSIDAGLTPAGEYDAPSSITSTEVMVASHDGVQVPLSIIHRKDIRLDGSNPTLLSGYGAYGHTSEMKYKPLSLAWLEQGGVLAIAHVRGGGIFGKAWHHAGRKATKPNTWKDFIACAEHLVSAGYTKPEKLAGAGRSAGGILIGRAITQRPDLFAAAHIAVGCTDMLRFETTMNGPPNIPEYGSVAQEAGFRGLLAMSAFHHIRDGVKYPAVLLTHGSNDPRVEPWQSAKTTARLQAATTSGKPVLFRVDYHAGHGIGSTKEQRHEEQADVWSFLLWQLNASYRSASADVE